MKLQIRRYRLLICLFIIFYILIVIASSCFINVTKSEPLGIYFAYPWGKIKNNDLVLVCLSNKKYISILINLGISKINKSCNNKIPFLLKKIVASENDKVKVTTQGVYINNILIPKSKALLLYHKIALLPQMLDTQILKKHEFYVLGDSIHSYDSRYFGIISMNEIYEHVVLIYRFK